MTQTAGADYSIWSLCYAKADMPFDFFGGANIMSNKGTKITPMPFTLIRGGLPGEDHLYLVDCGFREPLEYVKDPFLDWEDTATVLGKVGVKPEDIEAILVTHMHFDHINQIEDFPNAHIYIQREEFNGWTMAINLPSRFKVGELPWVYSSFEPKDMIALAKAEIEGRVTLLDGDTEVFPGITGNLARRTHTFGTCWWKVLTQNGPFIITGDSVYWYANIENMWPPGYGQGDSFNLLFHYDNVLQAAEGDLSRIVPGHDSDIYTKHASWEVGKNPVAEINLAKGQKSLRP
ncbi:MAG: MBL fold metallo-hydrolase [Deltaproteobacteria bacterium]|nr:MBL fold metallo-hydrolase [Deltaproteobacteria bacterium]